MDTRCVTCTCTHRGSGASLHAVAKGVSGRNRQGGADRHSSMLLWLLRSSYEEMNMNGNSCFMSIVLSIDSNHLEKIPEWQSVLFNAFG